MNIYIHSKIGCLDYSPNSHSPIYPPPTLCLHPVFCFIVGNKIDNIDDVDDVDDDDNNNIPTFSAEKTVR